MPPKITRIEAKTFSLEIEDFTSEDGLNTIYNPGKSIEKTFLVVKVCTNTGVNGEYQTCPSEVRSDGSCTARYRPLGFHRKVL